MREEEEEDPDDLDGFERADRAKEAKQEVKDNNRVSKSAHPSVRNKLNT